MKKFCIFLFVLVFSASEGRLFAQETTLVQFSGIVLSADSNHQVISFASIQDVNIGAGTISDFKGFFSMVINDGDDILITCLGYQAYSYHIQYDGHNPFISDTIYLKKLTLSLPETTVFPWGTRDQFADAFVHMNIPDDDLSRAEKNLDADYLAMIGKDMVFGDVNAHQVLTNYAASYYYKGQYRPIQLMNPIAWAQFFKMLSDGGLKSENK